MPDGPHDDPRDCDEAERKQQERRQLDRERQPPEPLVTGALDAVRQQIGRQRLRTARVVRNRAE